jgi:DNA-binding XRE family transcriptional regulator
MYAMTDFLHPIGTLRDLGLAFRAERVALGQTQALVAKHANCRRQTIIALESGKNVDLLTVMRVLAALGKGLRIVDQRVDPDRLSEIFNDDD